MKYKILFKFVLALCTCMTFITAAGIVTNADVVWEPEDDFYKQHADECDYVKVEMVANGPGGSVTIWKSPASSIEIDSMENSAGVLVYYTYTDKRGYKWGYISSGWVPMDYLIIEPGISNFYNKHEDEFGQQDADFTIPEGVETVYFWSYPGSGEVVDSRGVASDETMTVSPVYTDKDGRQWGYIGYFQLAKGWICMSDPSNDKIPVNEEDAAEVVTPPEPTAIIKPQPEVANIVILIAIFVVVVGAGTFALIRMLFKGKAASKAGIVDAAKAADAGDSAETASTADVAKAVDAAITADTVGAAEAPGNREIK